MRMYTPEKTVSYENKIMACYLAARAGLAPLRFAPPVELWIEAYFEVPKSYSKAKAERCRANDPPPCCKPDMDNITKAVADALNGVAYRDDTAITDQHIAKRYGSQARLVITLRGVPEETDGEEQSKGRAGLQGTGGRSAMQRDAGRRQPRCEKGKPEGRG